MSILIPSLLRQRTSRPLGFATRAAVLVTVLATTTTATAQVQFSALQHRTLPGEPGSVTASGDVDGDGDLDLVLGGDTQCELWRNDGFGTFDEDTARSLPTMTRGARILALGDLDGDGDLDLIRGTYSGVLYLDILFVYRNDGAGVFTGSALPELLSPINDLALGDVDGDGDLDLLIGTGVSNDLLFLNDGGAGFTDVTATQMPAEPEETTCVELCDLDGDGDLDQVLGRRTYGRSRASVYLNDGHGVFTDASATHVPPGVTEPRDLVVGDVDADGDPDVLLANAHGDDLLYLNDGNGILGLAPAARLPTGSSDAVDLGDVDGDGDLDLLRDAQLLLNDGTGSFLDATGERIPSGSLGPGRFDDLDGDGALDVLLPRRLLLNDGGGHYFDASGRRLPDGGGESVTPADVDGDGDLDLVLAMDGQNRLFLNDGSGRYTDHTDVRMPRDTDFTRAIAAGDLDGDGDLDLICGNDGIWYWGAPQRHRLYLNDGSGAFVDATSARMPGSAVGYAWAIELVDVDRDGDSDVLCANQEPHVALYLNDGRARFTDATLTNLPQDPNGTRAFAVGDVDGDGDPDLVLGRTGNGIWGSPIDRLYLNDGSGVFVHASATALPRDSQLAPAQSVHLGDVDGDGDLDLLFASARFRACPEICPPVSRRVRLYLHDAPGTFSEATSSRLPPADPFTSSAALGDIDLDGDLDLVVAIDQFEGGPIDPRQRIYLNDGNGTFTDASDARISSGFTSSRVVLADVDGDDDPDLVFSDPSQVHLSLNLLRQLDAPTALRIGRPLVLDAYARHGPPRLFDVALPVLSTSPAAVPLPGLGLLRIDTSSALALGPVLIPPAGTGTVSWTIPDLPALAGTPVFAQAVIVRYGLDERLSNVVQEAVR